MFGLLELFVNFEPTFSKAPTWEKRVNFLSLCKTQSMLDLRDTSYYKNLLLKRDSNSKSVDNFNLKK